jgi:hypothetical protein
VLKAMKCTKRKIEIHVEGCPPRKHFPKNNADKQNNEKCTLQLAEKVSEILQQDYCIVTEAKISIKYQKYKGRSDYYNILGGIMESLKVLIPSNNVIRELHYTEKPGKSDEYWIEIEGLFFNRVILNLEAKKP